MSEFVRMLPASRKPQRKFCRMQAPTPDARRSPAVVNPIGASLSLHGMSDAYNDVAVLVSVATPFSRSQSRAPSAEHLSPNENKMGSH